MNDDPVSREEWRTFWSRAAKATEVALVAGVVLLMFGLGMLAGMYAVSAEERNPHERLEPLADGPVERQLVRYKGHPLGLLTVHEMRDGGAICVVAWGNRTGELAMQCDFGGQGGAGANIGDIGHGEVGDGD